MTVYETPPAFYDNADQIISAADLRMLRENAALVDGLTYRSMPIFDSTGGGGTPTPETQDVGGFPGVTFTLWYGFIRYRAGMTTLTVTGSGVQSQSEVIKVYLNGSGTASATITPAASFTATISIASGYSDGQIIAIVIKVEGGHSTTGRYVIYDVYASPITIADAWPGVPTFTTTFSASALNQLVAATRWVYDRVAATPLVPNLGHVYALGAFKSPDYRTMYYGAVLKGYSNSILRVYGTFTNVSSAALRFQIKLAGSVAYTSGSYGPGTYTFSVPISLAGVATGDRAEVSIHSETVDAGPRANWKFSRWTFQALQSEPDASGYPYAALPADHAALTALTGEQLRDWLNALAGIVSAAKARIDATPWIFNRARALRRHYAKDFYDGDPIQMARFKPRFSRFGSALLVRGKGVKIAYGPIALGTNPASAYEDHTFLHTESVIDGDKLDTKTIYLDTLPGLTPGTTYYLLGDVQYAHEEL